MQLAVAQAVAAGAKGCECAVVIAADGGVFDDDLDAVRDLGGESVRVLGVLPSGQVVVDLPGGSA